MRILAITAAAVLITGAAYAQDTTGASKTHQNNPQTVPQSQQTGAPLTSGLATPGQPGSGYQAPTKASTTAPGSPATRDGGELPKGGKNKD